MKSTRRTFLKHGLQATGVVALVPGTLARGATASAAHPAAFPPHEPLPVTGVHAYADRESAAPGERVALHVSHDVPVRAAVYRLGTDVDDPSGDTMMEDLGTVPARPQPIHPGSYVHVARGLSRSLSAVTLEAWVRVWRLDRLMGVVSQEDKESSEGWALGIGKDGYVGFYLGDGVSPDEALVHRTDTGVIRKGRWHHVVARWNGAVKQVWVDGVPVAEWPFAGPLRPGSHPIRLGAMGEAGRTTRFLDGDLAMVVIRAKALPDAVIRSRSQERGAHGARGRDVLGCWRFAEERGDRVADGSGARRHGRLINHGTWMVGGPAFDASVPRFGDYRPESDATRGHALRLASDDLYNCHWEPAWHWRVPAAVRSGMYVLRLRWNADGQDFFQHATWVVRRAARRRPAPILLLAATNTWRAYNAAPFGVPRPGIRQLCGTDGLPNAPGNPPAFSFYRGHAAGQGSYQLGSRVPWPASNPYLRYGDATEYSHLARADRFTQTWLEREGYAYEMITDHDLHRDPGQLRRHRVLVINGHSEYWSIEMYRGLSEYLAAGGHVVVLSGNSLFWRVTYNAEGSILECRKVDAPGEQLRPEQRGEAWHSHDARRGGLMRECGFPGWKLIGLETLGWNNQGTAKNFGPWIAEGTDHPVFHEPEETGLKPGDRFGGGAEGTTPMANGHEFDVRLSTLATLATSPLPPGAVMPSDPPGIRRLANGVIPWKHGGSAFDYFFRPIQPASEQGGEMIWWERPDGGTVFNAGTIGAGWTLQADPRWASLLRNVLHRFGVPKPV
ncbi:MAG: LamG domain-containing protein [Verrucomicrobiales bacterium]|nr:LamG domain-containing protein [Verrucomicrobiales bacterium]